MRDSAGQTLSRLAHGHEKSSALLSRFEVNEQLCSHKVAGRQLGDHEV